MISLDDPEPDQRVSVIQVGQDAAGHWLVQESAGRLEGRFVSFDAAIAYARSERRSLCGATITLSQAPLVPIVPFSAVQPWERAKPHVAIFPLPEVSQ